MNKLDVMFLYENNRLLLLVVSSYKKNPILVYEKEIDTFSIIDLEKSNYILELKEKTLAAHRKVKEKFDINHNKVAVITAPESCYFKNNDFEKRFEEESVVNEEDVNRLSKYALNFEKIDENYKTVDFIISKYILDEMVVPDLIGKKALSIGISGDTIVADKKTINLLTDFFNSIQLEVKKIHVLEYYLKNRLSNDGDAVMILEKTKMKFITLTNDGCKFFTVNQGYVIFLEKLYDTLCEKYTENIAEKITRFFQKNWMIKKTDIDYEIMDNVNVNDMVNILQEVIIQYYQYIFEQIKLQNINIQKLELISNVIDVKDLSEFLDSVLDYKVIPFNEQKYLISSLIDANIGYTIKEIYKYKEN